MARFDECAGVLVTERGAWVPVVDSGEISTNISPLTSDFTSALGKRTAFFRGTAPREWSVSGSATWAQAQAIQRLAAGRGQKFFWVSPLGRHTNILSSDKPIYGLPLGEQLVDGLLVEVYGPNGWGNQVSVSAPVYEGLEVTASAYMAGGQLRIWWRDSAGALITQAQPKSAAAQVTLGLVEVSDIAPAGAVSAEVIGLKVSSFASPALRIGHDATKFEPGPAESRWVTLHDVQVSHGNIAYAHSPFQVSFTLKEVS